MRVPHTYMPRLMGQRTYIMLVPMQYCLMGGFPRPYSAPKPTTPSGSQSSSSNNPAGRADAGGVHVSTPSGDDGPSPQEDKAHGGPKHRPMFPVTLVLRAVELAKYLRNGDNMRHVVTLACQMAGCEPPDESAMPACGETLRRWRVKLDCMTMLWHRRLLQLPHAGDCLRFLNIDSSPQGGYNFLIIVEDIIYRPPLNVSEFDSPLTNFTWHRRTKPAIVMGSGRAKVVDKTAKTVHSATLEAGDKLDLWRQEVAGCVGDAGPEIRIPKSAFPFGPDGVATVADAVATLRSGNATVPELEQIATFLPNCVTAPGLQHIIFNALEEAFTSLDAWKEFEGMLKGVARVLGTKRYSDKFQATFMQAAPNVDIMFIEAVFGSVADWRWESYEYLTNPLLDGFPVFAKYFVQGEFMNAKEDSTAFQNAQHAVEQNEEFFMPLLQVMALITTIAGEMGRWCRGCPCHEQELTAHSTWAQRKHAMTAKGGSVHCVWKGRRGPELVLWRLQKFYDDISEATTPAYQEYLVTAKPRSAAFAVRVELNVRSRLLAIVVSKCSCIHRLPLKLLGCFGEFHGCCREKARTCCQECFAEFRAIENRNHMPTTAIMLLDLESNSMAATQLYEWGHTAVLSSLQGFPEACRGVQRMALVSFCEMPAEGEHRRIQIDLADARKPASVCALLRHKQTMELARNPDFVMWLGKSWSSKNVFVDTLAPWFTEEQVRAMTLPELHSHIYQYHLDDQFMDNAQQAKSMESWAAEVNKRRRTEDMVETPTAHLVVDYLKTNLLPGHLYSVRTNLLQRALQSVVADGVPAPSLTELHAAFADVALQGGAPLDDQHWFEIVTARPERMVLHDVAHVAERKTSMTIQRLAAVRAVTGSSMELSRVPGPPQAIELLQWARGDVFADVLGCLKHWEVSYVANPTYSAKVTGQADTPGASAMRPNIVIDDDPALVLRHDAPIAPPDVPDRLVADLAVHDILAKFVSRRAFIDGEKYLLLQETEAPAEQLERLCQQGVLVSRDSGFGDLEYALRLAALRMHFAMVADEAMHLTSVPWSASLPWRSRSKLDMFGALLQEGWGVVRQGELQPLTAKGSRSTSAGLLNKAKAYWYALLNIDVIFAKPGAPDAVFHDMPARYYEALITLKDLSMLGMMTWQGLHDYGDVGFKDMLNSEGWPAHPDGEDGDDDPDPPVGVDAVLPVHPPKAYRPKVQVEATKVTTPEGQEVKVGYDNFTHQSGQLRAFVTCSAPGHGNSCRLYRQVNTFPSKEHCCAYLVAWAVSGASLSGEGGPDGVVSAKERHRKHTPPPATVTAIYENM